MRKGVVIAGYYGADNTGDEAILTGMIDALRSEGIEDITVLSRNPQQTELLYGVKSIYIGRRFDGLWKIYRALRKSKVFILGGGGLLQDYTKRVVPYWLSKVFLALMAGTPVVYYAQGIGPLRTDFAKRLVKTFSNRVKWITVRDEKSFALLKELNITKPTIEVTADPALTIHIFSDGKRLIEEDTGVTLDENEHKIGIALRRWQGEEKYLDIFIDALNQLKQEYNLQLYFFPLQYGEDEGISEEVMQKIEGSGNYLIKKRYTPEQMAAMLKEMDGVIAMRLHALILSALSHTPSYGLVYDPKVYHFMKNIGTEEYSYPLEKLHEKEAFYSSLKSWMDNREAMTKKIANKVKEQQALSYRNAEIVKSLIDK